MTIRACDFLISNQANLFEERARNLLVPQNGFTARGAEPILTSGLYVVRSLGSTAGEQAYVVYWPEDTTWDDQAISTIQRNRVTFMRYVCLFPCSSQTDRTRVGTSLNYAIRSSAYSHQSIHKQ